MWILASQLLGSPLALAREEEEDDDSGGGEVTTDRLTADRYWPGEGLSFSTHRGHTLRLFTYLQPAMDVASAIGDPESDPYTRFRMRRVRLRVDGSSPDDRAEFRLQVDLVGANEAEEALPSYLLDAFITYRLGKNTELSFGQRATPTDNRELFMLSHTLQLPERSRLTSAFAAIREFGLFATDRLRFGQSQHYLKPYLALTSGDGPNVFTPDYGGLKYGARLDYLPLGLFTRYGQFREVDLVRELTPKLVVGAAYSVNEGMSSRRGRESGAILYLDEAGAEALPTFRKLGIDFLFKYRGFSMLGEYTRTFASVPDTITQRVRTDGSVSDDFDGDVDAYVRGRMMLGRGYNLQAGYVLPTQTSVDVRYTRLDADEHSFLNNETFYNRQTYLTGGLSQYFRADYGLKVQGSVTWVDALPGSNDRFGEPLPGDEWIGSVIATLAL